jgi:hypothetical protein
MARDRSWPQRGGCKNEQIADVDSTLKASVCDDPVDCSHCSTLGFEFIFPSADLRVRWNEVLGSFAHTNPPFIDNPESAIGRLRNERGQETRANSKY